MKNQQTPNVPSSEAPSRKGAPKSDGSPRAQGKDGALAEPSGGAQSAENDFFNKHYNKELRVSKDEIPIVLAELNESAIAFIKKDQFERALNLLQKAYGIMDAIDFTTCRRDMFHLFIMFHNMALCYQKMQMLEECAQCIEHAFEQLPINMINLEEKSISYRMRKIYIIGKLKLQYCAILSQIHRHKDALEQAREGVKVCHQMINDMHQLCSFYVTREKINNAYKDSNPNQNDSQNNQGYEEYSSRFEGKRQNSQGSRNRSFSSFLSQQEAYTGGFDSFNLGNKGNNNSVVIGNQKNKGRKGHGLANNQSVGNISKLSSHSLSSFCTVNELEKSMSYVEKTAKKLLPILIEVKKKMIPDKKKGKNRALRKANGGEEQYTSDIDDDDDLILDLNKAKGNKNLKNKNQQFDMKNILGYLNQGENLQTLSIGNIMQLQSFKLKDLIEEGKNELELTRESFIYKISHLAVSYFCYSTEIRFIMQMKEDPNFDPNEKQVESEYWHAKSLEIACSFLPGECPLLNHINLSYQKHFAPVKAVIKEDEEEEDNLIVVKPLNGIEIQKYHPIIKNMQELDVSITPYQMTPLNAVTKPFINQLKSFNEYTESQKSQSNNQSFLNQSVNQQNRQNNSSKNSGMLAGSSIGNSKHHKSNGDINQRKGIDGNVMEGISEDGQNESIGADSETQELSDMQKLERMFKKVQGQYKIDKVKLFNQLINQQSGIPSDSQHKNDPKNKQILNKHTSSRQEDTSQDQFSGVDFLMDENILTNDSREEEGRHVRTPDNIKNLNVNSINNINSSNLSNHAKKIKGSAKISTGKGTNAQQAQMSLKNQLLAQQNPNIPQQQNLHQRPKTQINGQRMQNSRDQRMATNNSNSQQNQPQQNKVHQSSVESAGKPSSSQGGYQTSKSNVIHQPAQAQIPPNNMTKYSQQNPSLSSKMSAQQMAPDPKQKRSAQRPFSGGIQKMIKSDSHKSRVQNLQQKNFSMYDQKMSQVGMVSGSSGMHSASTHQSQSQKQGLTYQGPHTQQGVTLSNSAGVFNNQSPQKMLSGNNSREQQQHYYNQQQQNPQKSTTPGANGQHTSQSQGRQGIEQSSQIQIQKQLQQLQKQNQQIGGPMGSNSASNLQMKNQLQGAATNIIGNNAHLAPNENQAQYEDLKKKLLSEYKKIQKKGGVVQYQQANQPNQEIIEQTLQNSANAMNQSQQRMEEQNNGGNSQNSQGNGNNLNNSTTSAHLNVYKPTFIINNSYQPGSNGDTQVNPQQQRGEQNPAGQKGDSASKQGQQQHSNINNPQNLPVTAAGPGVRGSSASRTKDAHMQRSTEASDNGKIQHQGAIVTKSAQAMMKKSSAQNAHGMSKLPKNQQNAMNSNQQQILLMNVLINQGMSKAQAEQQVAAQMHQMGSKTLKEGRSSQGFDGNLQMHSQSTANIHQKPKSSGARHQNASGRGITPTQEQKGLAPNQQPANYAKYQNQMMVVPVPQADPRAGASSAQAIHHKNNQQFIREQQYVPHGPGGQMNQYHPSQGGPSSQALIKGQPNANALSAANLPQASNVVTGGKMLNSSLRGNSQTAISRQEIQSANQSAGQHHQGQFQNLQIQQQRRK